MPVVMEISFYHYYSVKSLMRLQSRDCTFVQKAGFSLQFHCRLTVKVCSVEQTYLFYVPYSKAKATIVVQSPTDNDDDSRYWFSFVVLYHFKYTPGFRASSR